MLQQHQPIAFFGTADRGDEITVEFNGRAVSAKVGENGKWRAEFPSMEASSINRNVKITDGKKLVELKDILIGEVWFCSGQSNMQMPIGAKFNRGWSAQNCEQEVAANAVKILPMMKTFPLLRKTVSTITLKNGIVKWKQARYRK